MTNDGQPIFHYELREDGRYRKEDIMFTVKVDPATRTVNVVMTGFWDVKTVDEYEHALLRARAALSQAKGRIYWCIDGRHLPVQSMDVIERVQALRARMRATGDDVYALVFAPGLAAMQAKRVASREEIFTSAEEANAWLAQQHAADTASA